MYFCRNIFVYLITLLFTVPAFSIGWGQGAYMASPMSQCYPTGSAYGNEALDKEDIKYLKKQKKVATKLQKDADKLERQIKKQIPRSMRELFEDEDSYYVYVKKFKKDLKDNTSASEKEIDLVYSKLIDGLKCKKVEEDSEIFCSKSNFTCKNRFVNQADSDSAWNKFDEITADYNKDSFSCGGEIAGFPNSIQEDICSDSSKSYGYNSLDKYLKGYIVVDEPSKTENICRSPNSICRVFEKRDSSRAAYKDSCEKIINNFNPELAKNIEEHDFLLSELANYEDELADTDFYTEGSFCYECYYGGTRKFVDDRSGTRKFFDSALPILGALTVGYGQYRLGQNAIQARRDLGFSDGTAPNFWQAAGPGLWGGIQASILAGRGQGGFGCSGMMAGMNGYGMNGYGMMGGNLGGLFGNPFGGGFNGGFGSPFGGGFGSPYGGMIPGIGGSVGAMYPGFGSPWGMNGGYGNPFGGGFNGGFGSPFGGGFNGGFGSPYGGMIPGIGGSVGAMYPGFGGPWGMNGGFNGGFGPGGFNGGINGGYSPWGMNGGYNNPWGINGGINGGFGPGGINGGFGPNGGGQAWIQYQQQMLQQQMAQQRAYYTQLQQYQEQEAARARTRSNLQQQMYQLQMQLYQLESSGYGSGSYYGGFNGGINGGFNFNLGIGGNMGIYPNVPINYGTTGTTAPPGNGGISGGR